jgi:hypothetical protein
MARMPRDNSGPRVPWPARAPLGQVLPFRGYLSVYPCLDSPPGTERHRVLTTDQLAALAFGNITTARHRLAVVVRLGLLRRFRPHLQTGSAPWHYVLGPIGAALLGQEDRDEKRWLPMVRADRQLALERSQRLGHLTGASWFFVALARHAREHGGGELL